jgi:hypothetical protein
MPLKLRPTGLGSGIDKDRPDYTIYNSGWAVGRIYETRGGPDRLRPHLSDDTRRPRGDLGGGQGAVSEELGRLEGVGGFAGGQDR